MNRNYWFEIVNKLIEKKQTIATMESCTGGGIANEITNISGASAIIKESYVTYCNEAKIKHDFELVNQDDNQNVGPYHMCALIKNDGYITFFASQYIFGSESITRDTDKNKNYRTKER